MIRERRASKRGIRGELVYVHKARADERWMRLEEFASRALLRGEIHELAVSANPGLGPGAAVRDVAYIGFFEVDVGGVAEFGDEVWAGEKRLGTFAGFDLTHHPNHFNIVVSAEVALHGAELGLDTGSPIRFEPS